MTAIAANPVRLDKALARSGAGSRRVCDQLIIAGRVSVDGVVVTNPLTKVDPAVTPITVDGSPVDTARDLQYVVVNKPPGVVATMHDPLGRACLGDLVGPANRGLFHVGRLDAETAGLQILMNDGALAGRLTARALTRTYLAQLPGPVPPGLEAQLRAGVVVDGARLGVDDFRVVVSAPRSSMVEISLRETTKRGARRLLIALHQPPQRLVCVRVGPVLLGDLEAGRSRSLTEVEFHALLQLARE
ncbi:pseudouridine synthase [Nocardioides sp.]|uniref:pseudouridine synthase n=1 Tax=Nocardioides sp. TaxID=35761 RepID=UPI00261540DF|nr:pseudouridine synthase [Nocardioides sp.]MDI6911614.1 S4 domain-containing protein [Nocardioides sp.]